MKNMGEYMDIWLLICYNIMTSFRSLVEFREQKETKKKMTDTDFNMKSEPQI